MATTRIQIGPADRGRRMSLAEFREAEERPGYLYELSRGMVEVTNVPPDWHAQVVHNVHEAFSTYRRQFPGSILRIGHGSDIRLIISDLESDRHPDLAVVFRNAPRDGEGRRRAALAVEVVSPGMRSVRRDYEQKREEYLALGLREYWIVDPKLRRVAVLTRRGEGQGVAWEERGFSGGEAIGSELLPGFAGTVAELWADGVQ